MNSHGTWLRALHSSEQWEAPQILPTGTQQFKATGTFGNDSTGDVMSQVTWVSSATNVATIGTTGLVATVKAAGLV
jgi:Bacterial Ig-like domain (group 2)